VNEFNTDDEQVEELKKWWAENGRSVITGIVLGLGIIFGWKGWNQYVDQRGAAASAQYEQALFELSNGKVEAGLARAEHLIQEYSSTPYATLASLAIAKHKLAKGETVSARSHLQWAFDNTGDDGMREIVRLRLARVLLSEGSAAEAEQLLAGSSLAPFQPLVEELRGDIQFAQGQERQARDHYVKALAALPPDSGYRNVVEMKLTDLGTTAVE
jgi:predicted negative regulator of RcsB-dependent stress response